MAKTGRPRKPAAVRSLEGNRSRTPIPDEPAVSGAPVKPRHLGNYASEVWDRVLRSLPKKMFGEIDTEILTAYCEAAELHREAVLKVREQGAVVTSSAGAPYQNPWLSAQNKQAELLARLGAKLGASPVDRANMALPADDPPKSKFQGLTAIEGGRNAS